MRLIVSASSLPGDRAADSVGARHVRQHGPPARLERRRPGRYALAPEMRETMGLNHRQALAWALFVATGCSSSSSINAGDAAAGEAAIADTGAAQDHVSR